MATADALDPREQSVIVAEPDVDIILPPPTANNPLPALQLALQRDNNEQLTNLLASDPLGSSIPPVQALIFSTESLRTLLLRNVLTVKKKATVSKKPPPPPSLDVFWTPPELSIVGTHVLSDMVTPDFPSHQVVTYFLRPDPSEAALVGRHLMQLVSTSEKTLRHYRVVVLPDLSALVRKIFQKIGALDNPNVSLHTLSMDIFGLESDLFSLEYPQALTQAITDQMPSTIVSTAARALLKLQDVTGTIPRVQSFGTMGQAVLSKLLDLEVDEYLSESDTEKEESSSVAALLIMDRQVDFVTPLLTPLTYQGLLDDVLETDAGFLHVASDVINPPEADKKSNEKAVALSLSGSDNLFGQVRDQHVEHFGTFLQNQAKSLQASHAAIKDTTKDLQEIHQFVRNIPALQQNMQALTHHIHLAELVKKHSETPLFRQTWQNERSCVEGDSTLDVIDDWVSTQVDVWHVLKLLCLQSVCGGGVKSGRYDTLRRDIVQTYGFEFLFCLDKLEAAGLLRRREGLWDSQPSLSLSTFRKHLHLIHADVDTINPDDVSYVSSGYAPLSVRLIQASVKGFRPEVLSQVKVVDVRQQIPPQILPKPPPTVSSALNDDAGQTGVMKKKTLIVCYVGGITYMEIAALRFLSKRPSFPFHIVILTTHVTNGRKLLKTIVTPSVFR